MCSGLQGPQLSELVSFLWWELSVTFYLFHRHRVRLVGPVDLIFSMFSWWEGFGSSSLATLPLGFNCGFISTSACGSSPGVCSWGCPGGLGYAPGRARCGGGVAAWVSGVLAALATQGSWQLRKQEIQRSGWVWQPVLANLLQCLQNPPDREAGQATAHRGAKNWTQPKRPACVDARLFFACGSSGLRWRWRSCLACGDPGLPPWQELWPYQRLFSSFL